MDDSDRKQMPVSQPMDPKPAHRVSVALDLVKRLAQVVLKAEDKCDSWDRLVIIEAGVDAVIAELAVMGTEAIGVPSDEELEQAYCEAAAKVYEFGAGVAEYAGRKAVAGLVRDRAACVIAAQAVTIAEQAGQIEYLRNPGATIRTVGDDKLLVCDGCSKIVTEPHGWIDCCNTMRGSVASYERMIQQERDAYRDDVAKLKAEAEALTRRNALLVKAHKAAVYANAKLEMDPMDLDLEYAADVIEGNIRTEAWERAVLEYVAMQEAQKEGQAR
jgi:hypothetical protein